MIYFTSDTHFGHAGAIGFWRRPFASVAEMDEALVAGWNARVGAADEVWHLGDFAIKQGEARMAELLGRLDGTKHLVCGNNDSEETRRLAGWTTVMEAHLLQLGGVRLLLTHAPVTVVPEGTINFHGHSHGRRKVRPRQFDVGVDVRGLRPATLGEILKGRS
jgi:calcineurin-like phosphoesterase family protein